MHLRSDANDDALVLHGALVGPQRFMHTDLLTFLDYLDRVHERTRRVAACITAEALEWSPAPGRWTAADQVRHLAGIERWMYAETVSGRLSRYSGHGRDLADGLPALLAYYDGLHAEARAIFAALTPAEWTARVVTPAGVPITTWKWLRAMLEHEAHHRGQLYFTLGLRGIPTPPIYGLREPELLAQSAPGIQTGIETSRTQGP
jgi:uncharacterized damage-inducible protein DinB